MAMNTCGTCKFFGVRNDGEYPSQHSTPEGYALCGRIQQYECYAGQEKTEKALAMDGSGYYAALCVTTDFGCTEWEAKP